MEWNMPFKSVLLELLLSLFMQGGLGTGARLRVGSDTNLERKLRIPVFPNMRARAIKPIMKNDQEHSRLKMKHGQDS